MILMGAELVERDRQLARLTESFRECSRGQGRVAVIQGPVASGKTELLFAFTDTAKTSGALVLSASAAAAEQALPLSVIDQLFHGADLPSEMANQVRALLDDGSRALWLDSGQAAIHQEAAQILHGLCKGLLDLAGDRTLVIAVDDAHHADLPSQQCLSFLVRRLRSTPVMVVLTESPQLKPLYTRVHTELIGGWDRRPIKLEPMSDHAVGIMLSRHHGLAASHLTDQFHFLSGGSPVLLRALIDDFTPPGGTTPIGQLLPGKSYAAAVLSCLYRCEPITLEAATILAALDGPAQPQVLGQLLDVKPEVAERAIGILNEVGILHAGSFRHPQGRDAVLAGMTQTDSAALHGRIAVLTHGAGASATAVGRHLVLAGPVGVAWEVPTLREAAEQALLCGDVEQSLSYGRAAYELCVDDQQRIEMLSLLVRAKWRMDPSHVLPHLADLFAAARAGLLGGNEVVAVVNYLLWHGWLSQALELLDMACSAPNTTPESVKSIGFALAWLSYTYPEQRQRVDHYWDELARHDGAKAADTMPKAARTLAVAMVAGPDHRPVEAADMAETVLHQLQLSDDSLLFTVLAMAVLFVDDRPGKVDSWCESMLRRTSAWYSPTWRALLLAARAEAAYRRGQLQAAEEFAISAMRGISVRGWSFMIGDVLSTLVLASSAAGRYETAAHCLQEPVPPEMFSTPFGMKYLHARGSYYLATHQPEQAVTSFQACGDAMTALRIDLPGLIPWRSGLDLAQGGSGQPHPPYRAVTSAEMSTSISIEPVGQRAPRRILMGDVMPAEQCRVHQPSQCRGSWPSTAYADYRVSGHAAPPAQDSYAPASSDLSEAERRVAALAAQGHTNREISSKLYVTVSTVEQHLTRVYRKLGVTRRSDLRSGLEAQLRPGDQVWTTGAPALPSAMAAQAHR